jgi:hypothetical protein
MAERLDHSSPLRAPVAVARIVQVPSQGLVARSAASNSSATCSGATVTTSVGGTGGGVASVATLLATSRQVTAWATARARRVERLGTSQV